MQIFKFVLELFTRISTGILILVPIWWLLSTLFRPESLGYRIVLGLLLIAIAVVIKIVWSIFNKPKKLVLFLRKFNSTELNNAISSLSSSKFSNNYRLITLDDSDFENIGIKKTQNFLIFAFLFLIVLVLGFISVILILIYTSNQGSATAEGEAGFFMGLATTAAIMLPLVFALIAMLVYNYATYRFAIYHENISVNNERGFALAKKVAKRLKKKSFTSKSKGAISTLIGSADNWWKECVGMLAGESDLIIICLLYTSPSPRD